MRSSRWLVYVLKPQDELAARGEHPALLRAGCRSGDLREKAGGGRWNNADRFGAGSARPRHEGSEQTAGREATPSRQIRPGASPEPYRGSSTRLRTFRSAEFDTAVSVRGLPARNLTTGDAYARAFSMPAWARAKEDRVMAAIATRIHASFERFASINKASSSIVPYGEPISLGACGSPLNDQPQNH